MPEFPDVTEVARFTWQPGDRFLLRISEPVGEKAASDIAHRFRAYAQLPPEIPVLVIPSWMEVSIVSEDAPSFDDVS